MIDALLVQGSLFEEGDHEMEQDDWYGRKLKRKKLLQIVVLCSCSSLILKLNNTFLQI
jgi:hypothetical protein